MKYPMRAGFIEDVERYNCQMYGDHYGIRVVVCLMYLFSLVEESAISVIYF
jgi:hypothetical protein